MDEPQFTERLRNYTAEFTKNRLNMKKTAVKAYRFGLPEYMNNEKFPSGDEQQIPRIPFATAEDAPENGTNVTKTFYGFTRNQFYASGRLGRRDGADNDWFPIDFWML